MLSVKLDLKIFTFTGPVTELNSITPLGIQSSAINAINKIAIRNNVHNINVSLNT